MVSIGAAASLPSAIVLAPIVQQPSIIGSASSPLMQHHHQL